MPNVREADKRQLLLPQPTPRREKSRDDDEDKYTPRVQSVAMPRAGHWIIASAISIILGCSVFAAFFGRQQQPPLVFLPALGPASNETRLWTLPDVM
jgi:hypothetical protein